MQKFLKVLVLLLQGAWENVENDQEKVDAAVLIQSHVRGWLQRKQYDKMKRAALKIQAAYRIHNQQKVEQERRPSPTPMPR